MYQRKRDVFISAVNASRFKLKPSKGTYFQLLDYGAISDEEDQDIAVRLTKEFKIASIPISVFYHNPVQNNVLRFCFAKEEETLLTGRRNFDQNIGAVKNDILCGNSCPMLIELGGMLKRIVQHIKSLTLPRITQSSDLNRPTGNVHHGILHE